MTGPVNIGQQWPESGVLADLARHAAAREVVTLVDGEVLGVVLEGGQQLHQIKLEQYAAVPRRATGLADFGEAESFCTYVARHKDPAATTLWGDLTEATVTAVLNDHEHRGGQGLPLPGWGDHRAVLQLAATPDWTHWTGADGKLMSQTAFAEFLEDGATALVRPAAADMLEVASTFQARTGVDFKSAVRLQSGETRLRYEETVNASAGKTGDLEIPSDITLGLEPFEGSPRYEVAARFRYRINNGQLTLGYRLVRPDLARRQAFADVLATITNTLGLPVLSGTPRS